MKKLLLTLLLALAVGTGAAWAETVTYKLVTDAADIKDGDEIVIAFHQGFVKTGKDKTETVTPKAISTLVNTNNRKVIDATVTDNCITIDDANTTQPQIMRFTVSGSTDNWTFKTVNYNQTNQGYLTTVIDYNYLKVNTTANNDGSQSAKITISDGNAHILFQLSNGRNNVCFNYNNGSSVFAAYRSDNTSSNGYAPYSIFKKESNTPQPLPLEKVTLEGADENGNISVTQGATMKFNAPNAAMYEISGDITADGLVENGKFEYIVNFPEGTDVLNITVTPYDEEPETLEGTASTFTITKIAAPDCGELTFTPASGTAIKAGSTISFSADNAATYHYGINTETESEFSAGASFTVSENDFIDGKCTVRAYPVNGDGKRGATVVAEYTLKEADRYALVNNLAHITPNATYILLGCKTDLSECALMGKQNSTKFYDAILLNKSLEEIISIAPNDNTFNDLSKFNILKNKENYNILLSNGKYLVRNSSDISSSETVTSNADFAITFDAITGEVVISQPNKATNTIQYNSQSPRFKTYTSSQSPVYLYRLIDKEYDTEVPEELYIHGHFYDRYYDLDKPVAMEKTGDKTFSSSDIMLGGNADHTGDALSFVLTTHIPTASVARSHESADWARLTEGKVYHSGGKTAAADVNDGSEITPYTVDEHDYYTISADFSGYAPVITATRQNGTTTGVEDVDTDATDAPVEYFNLQGVRVDNPGAGIFIRRQGKTVTKVVVK